MNKANLLLANISSLSRKSDITQTEIDNMFYENSKEISFFYSSDTDRVKEFFKDNLDSLEARLAYHGMAFDFETLKNTASITNHFKKVGTNKKILFKEILLTKTGIKTVLVDEITNEINNKIKGKKGKINYEYIFEEEIENLKDTVASIEYIIQNISNDLLNVESKLNTILKNKDSKNQQTLEKYSDIIDSIYKIPLNYSAESNLFKFENDYVNNEDLIDFSNSLKKIFKKEDVSEIKKDINYNMKLISLLFTKEIGDNLKTFKIRLKNKKNKLEMYQVKNILLEISTPEDKLLFNNTFSKTNTLDNNKLIFNNISQFISKYLSNYYIVEENKISLKDPQNYFINDFNITNDVVKDLDFDNTYTLKHKYGADNTGKIDFISSILFYKNNILEYNDDENIIDSSYINYLKVKESLISTNQNTLNNSNKIFLESEDLKKLLKSIDKSIELSNFGNLFYEIKEVENDENKEKTDISSKLEKEVKVEKADKSNKGKDRKNKIYYGIQDKDGKNLSNLKEIKEFLKIIIIDEKLNKSSYSNDILEKIYDGVINIINNNIPIIGLTITGRRDINKLTSTTTSIFNLYEKSFSTNYAKFYQSTKDNIFTKTSIFTNEIDNSYIKDEFAKCIDNTFDLLMEKVEARIKLYFEKNIGTISL